MILFYLLFDLSSLIFFLFYLWEDLFIIINFLSYWGFLCGLRCCHVLVNIHVNAPCQLQEVKSLVLFFIILYITLISTLLIILFRSSVLLLISKFSPRVLICVFSEFGCLELALLRFLRKPLGIIFPGLTAFFLKVMAFIIEGQFDVI